MLRRIIYVLPVITLPVIFTACLTSKKVDRQVARQYKSVPVINKKMPGDNIVITSDLISDNNNISSTETKTSDLLPLIVYWQWDYKNTCTLNPQIPINNFSETVKNYAGNELNNKLAGQNLEISIDKIPTQFAIDDKSHLIFFGYAYGWDNVSIKATDMEMIVSYRVLKDNAETKKGSITIPSFNDKKKLGMFKSWKKATTEYLDQYDKNIAAMSKLFVDKLIKEL